MRFDVTQTIETDETEWIPRPSGLYHLRCVEAQIAPSQFPDKKTGELRDELTVVWKFLDAPQHPEAPKKDYWQVLYDHMPPIPGSGPRGPYRFKQFIDRLYELKLIPREYEIAGPGEDPKQGDLVGIEIAGMIKNQPLTMGPNVGRPTNKLVDWLPIEELPRGRSSGITPPATPAPPAEPPAVPRRTAYTPPTAQPADPFNDPANAGEPPDAMLTDMSRDELIDYAKTLADEYGTFWQRNAKRGDFDKMDEQELRATIGRISRGLKRNNPDPNKEIFD